MFATGVLREEGSGVDVILEFFRGERPGRAEDTADEGDLAGNFVGRNVRTVDIDETLFGPEAVSGVWGEAVVMELVGLDQFG